MRVCLCAGWTLGQVKERHLKHENTGDELVGSSLTGVPLYQVSLEFHHVTIIHMLIIKYFSNFMFVKQDVQALNSICLMMVCFIFHKEWTKGNISDDSPLLDSRYYSFTNLEPN